MTFVPPCARPENDPDDWFIGRDGKQYPDDVLVSEEEVIAHLDEVDPHGTRSVEAIDAAAKKLEAEAIRQALIRRRHARDKCFVECIVRTECLTVGMRPENLEHGIYGGYYPEERRKMQSILDERAARRRERGVPAEE